MLVSTLLSLRRVLEDSVPRYDSLLLVCPNTSIPGGEMFRAKGNMDLIAGWYGVLMRYV